MNVLYIDFQPERNVPIPPSLFEIQNQGGDRKTQPVNPDLSRIKDDPTFKYHNLCAL